MSAKKIYEVAMILSAKDQASRVIAGVTTEARRRIEGMSRMGDRAFDFGRKAGTAGLVGAGLLAIPLKAAADMEKLNISLKTSFQGNEKAAADAFTRINKFAAKTPYELGEVTTAFIKLKNMGLDPSEDALTAYGNTASAMGKNLNDMIEAVSDAATGEFERLKEFGIKAKSEGDKVTFLFQGVKTTVGKNAKEIEQYLKYVGNVKFKGGIEAQSKSIYGQLSTLKDGVMMTAAKIGTTMIPKLKEMFAKIGPVIDKVAAWVEKNPKLTTTIMKVVAGATALSFAVAALSFAFGGVFKAVAGVMWLMNGYKQLMLVMKAAQMAYTFTLLGTGSGFAAVSAGLKAMNLAFLTSPIFWIGALLVGVVVLIWKYWGPIKEFFGKIWDGIKAVFAEMVKWIKNWWFLFGPIGVLIKFWGPITKFFGKLWEGIKKVFSGFWEFVKKWWPLLLGPVGIIILYWDKISGFFKKLWDKIKGYFMTFYVWLRDLPKSFNKIGGDIISGIWEGMKAKALGLFNYVKEMGNKIAKTFKSVLGIASPSKVFMEYGVNIADGASKGIQKGSGGAAAAAKGMGNKMTPVAQGRGSSFNAGGISITFAPTISGGGNAQDILAQLKKYTPELIREIESQMARRQRLSF